MSKTVRIRSGNYHFYLDGRRIYIKINTNVRQQFIVKTIDQEELNDEQYVHLIDAIYRKRIVDTSAFNSHVFSKFRLYPTSRVLK